jgi:hypothetical protein
MSASSHLELGTLPEWVDAIGTTLAFFVAFAVLLFDRRERRRRQAGQIAAWLERGDSKVILHVINASDAVAYNVQVTPQLLHRVYDEVNYPLIGPGKDETPLTIELPGNQQVSNDYLGVEMSFTDSAGRRWKRLRSGRLKRRVFR